MLLLVWHPFLKPGIAVYVWCQVLHFSFSCINESIDAVYQTGKTSSYNLALD
jgi:hypothetical protein